MIVIKTGLLNIPESCSNCPILSCHLPCYANKPDQIKMAYWKKRHKDCPLMVIEVVEE